MLGAARVTSAYVAAAALQWPAAICWSASASLTAGGVGTGDGAAAAAGDASLPRGGGGGPACGFKYCGTKYAAAPATRARDISSPQFGPDRRRRYV